MRTIGWYTNKILIRTTQPLPFGIRNAIRNLFTEFKYVFIHFGGLARARKYRHIQGLKLHLGCGNVYKEGWINIDLGQKADLKLDLRRRLPLANNSATIIYGEHFFEHIDFQEPALDVLKDYFRILEPGGVLSLVVPDMEMVLKAYVLSGSESYYEAQKKWHPDWCVTQMDHVNHNFRQEGEQKYSFDYETLHYYLQLTGFDNIHRRDYDPTLDREDRIVGSLYVNCNKPVVSP
jgi:predicted SAM-dependent methyltransferase